MGTKSVNTPKPAPKKPQHIAAKSGEEGQKVTRNTSNSREEVREIASPLKHEYHNRADHEKRVDKGTGKKS